VQRAADVARGSAAAEFEPLERLWLAPPEGPSVATLLSDMAAQGLTRVAVSGEGQVGRG
jgi:hypothetical protein